MLYTLVLLINVNSAICHKWGYRNDHSEQNLLPQNVLLQRD